MYRSKLEALVGGLLGPTWAYEPFKVPYVTYRNYTPDFVWTIDDYYEVLVEVKGFFRAGDTAKYKAIRDACMEEGSRELVFFLQSPRSKIRKGAKMTMAEWCDKESIRWFDNVETLKAYVEDR